MSITIIILVVTVAISILALDRRDVMARLMFNPYVIQVRGEWYRFISHGLIHADYMHLAVNMLVLYGFGRIVEEEYFYTFGPVKGRIAFLIMYTASIAVASISSFIKYKNNPGYNSLGASGATSAVIFASILFNPLGKIGLFFIPGGIPGIVLGVLYLFYSSYMGRRGGDNINHEAHFYGALFGFFYTLLLKPELGKLFIWQIKDALGM